MKTILGILLTASAACAATYTVDAKASTLMVHTGKAGFFSSAGHTHEIRATELSGEVVVEPTKVAAARLTLIVPAAGLRVQGTELSDKDRNQVEKNMEGDAVLDQARFPEIKFVSKKVTDQAGKDSARALEIDGTLSLHGASRPITVPATVTFGENMLTARGEVTFKQSDFGIKPFRAVLGAVGVKNEVRIKFEIVARAQP